MPGTFGKAEKLTGPRRSQPLKVQRQQRTVEVLAFRGGGDDVFWHVRRVDFREWHAGAIHGAKPVVPGPDHALDGSFAAEGAASTIAKRTAAEMHHVGLAIRGFDEVGMPGALQFDI